MKALDGFPRTRKVNSAYQMILAVPFLSLALLVTACSGPVALSPTANPGDSVWALIAWRDAGVWQGPQAANYRTVRVLVGKQPAEIVDVVSGTSTRKPAGIPDAALAVVYRVPVGLPPGRYPVTIYHLDKPLTPLTGQYYVEVPK